MAGRQRILPIRREYNRWVANQTLEDYALRFTAKSARRFSTGRVSQTAIGAISFLALEAIGGAITLSHGTSNVLAATLVVGIVLFVTGLPIARYASRYGVDIDLLTRGAGFGYIGSTITSASADSRANPSRTAKSIRLRRRPSSIRPASCKATSRPDAVAVTAIWNGFGVAQASLLVKQDDVIILDGRSNYEFDLGHFHGAIKPDLKTFREFPEWIRSNLTEHKDKPILTYCTGGIRCEMLTAVLKNEGFNDVYQLDGGIVTYGKDPEVQGRGFDGNCYVFDERISVRINQTDEHTVVGECHHCGTKTDRYINCADDTCHLQHLVCDKCEEEHRGYCSSACAEHDLTAAGSAG